MKKVLILILLILICTGCNGNTTRDIRHQGYSMNGLFKCERVYSKDKNDPVDKIKYLIDGGYVNQNGELYDVSLSGIFSNEENCKKSVFTHKIKAIYNTDIVKADDNLLYYIKATDKNEAYSLVNNLNELYPLYSLLLRDEDILKVQSISELEYYILKADGNIYDYVLSKDDNNNYSVVSTNIIYDKSGYGNIVDFYYAGNSLRTYLISDKGIYRMNISNRDVCSKYVDVVCEYEFVLNEVLTKYKDRIIAYNGNNIITDYGQIFNISE